MMINDNDNTYYDVIIINQTLLLSSSISVYTTSSKYDRFVASQTEGERERERMSGVIGKMIRMPPSTISQRRVVVTGLGAVTPLGIGARTSWNCLLERKSGVTLGEEFESAKGLPRLRAEVPSSEFQPIQERLEKECGSGVKGVRCIAFGVAAADEAILDADLRIEERSSEWRDRAGVCVGTGIGSIEILSDASCLIDSKRPKGYRRLSPYFVPRTLVNLTAGQISMKHGLRGPNHACSNACATGANSIGDAYRFIQRGDADVMIAGGTEACIHPVSVAGFAKMRALCTFCVCVLLLLSLSLFFFFSTSMITFSTNNRYKRDTRSQNNIKTV